MAVINVFSGVLVISRLSWERTASKLIQLLPALKSLLLVAQRLEFSATWLTFQHSKLAFFGERTLGEREQERSNKTEGLAQGWFQWLEHQSKV